MLLQSSNLYEDFRIFEVPPLCYLKCRDKLKLEDCRQVGILDTKLLCLLFQANDAKSEPAQVSSVLE